MKLFKFMDLITPHQFYCFGGTAPAPAPKVDQAAQTPTVGPGAVIAGAIKNRRRRAATGTGGGTILTGARGLDPSQQQQTTAKTLLGA